MELPNIGTVLGIIYGAFAVLGLIVLFLAALCDDEAHECNLCGEMFLAEHDEWLCPKCHKKLSEERDREKQQQTTNTTSL